MSDGGNKCAAIYGLLRADWGMSAIAKELKVCRTSVYKAKKAMAASEKQTPPPRKGRPRTSTRPAAAAAILRKVRAAPTKPLREIARDLKTNHTAVNVVVKEAGFRSLRKRKIPLLSEVHRTKQLARGSALLNDLKSTPHGRIMFFFG